MDRYKILIENGWIYNPESETWKSKIGTIIWEQGMDDEHFLRTIQRSMDENNYIQENPESEKLFKFLGSGLGYIFYNR